MPKYTVDGSFFVQQLSGIQRYAREILAAMDPMLEPGELEVAVPPDCIVPEYRNIKVVTLPQSSGILGWQRVYGRYLAQSGRCWLGMCNVIPPKGHTGEHPRRFHHWPLCKGRRQAQRDGIHRAGRQRFPCIGFLFSGNGPYPSDPRSLFLARPPAGGG